MLTKKLVVIIAAVFIVVITVGILAVMFVFKDNGDSGLHRTEGSITLIADPAEVTLEAENQIHLMLKVVNSGTEPILAWALDIGDDLYLMKAEPKELLYHKGAPHGHREEEDEHEDEHEDEDEHEHGDVLIYAIPIEPGDIFQVELTLRVLFDIAGNFDPNPELRLFYARGAKDAQPLSTEDLQTFQDNLLTFPFAETHIYIEK
jgi:hypothetical protein